MTHVVILFFATFSAATMGVLLPGLVNMTAAKTSAQKGRTNGILFAIGASLVVIGQAYIGVLISKYLYRNTHIIDILLKIAVIVFAFFAIYFFVAGRKRKEKKMRSVYVSKRKSFFKGMLLSALNMLPIPYFCGINAAWNVSGWIKFELTDILIFILAAGLGTFTTLYIYVVYFNKMQDKTERFTKYSDYILSALMLVLVIITLIRIFYSELGRG
ncbi:LysE family transporter [Sinomicrobium weinanense]|uniref:LysE family transporter n=1 Tax=Sinomicrobium weinanense TaxID=2842200 RepID=A0A926JTU7_9FLAO|nr:LysE family transporter [Sinomicrobium weinanense]MBC9797417.1 LysE family transporter [Sinomicrobium weinanense]MBU3123089.1 LysE family transporter [Sinomicrobium weinanense]